MSFVPKPGDQIAVLGWRPCLSVVTAAAVLLLAYSRTSCWNCAHMGCLSQATSTQDEMRHKLEEQQAN